MLLEHTPQTAEQPWLTLAEPLLPVDKYHNTAFHVAAWNGSSQSLKHLVRFASEHSLPVARLLDIRKKTCLTIARERGNRRCVEILAPLFDQHVPKGLADRSKRDDEAVMFLDFERSGLSDLADNIPLAPPKDILSWLYFDGLSWLIREDVAARTYADDDTWITVAEGEEVVKVESTMRDCVWDVGMEERNLPERLRSCGFSYLRVAARRRMQVSKETSAKQLLESLQVVLGKIPKERRVLQLTLMGCTLLPSQGELDALNGILSCLLSCTTVTLRKCFCTASTLLHLLQALRHALCQKAYAWIGLYIIPLFLAALRGSKLCHISRSGCKSCKIPAAPLKEDDRFWVSLVESSLDVNRFVHVLRQPSRKEVRQDEVPAVFLGGVLRIWRLLFKLERIQEVKGAEIFDALDSAVELYVKEWLQNLVVPLEAPELKESEMLELLEQVDYAIWTLLRMRRLMPFVTEAVECLVPKSLLARLNRCREQVKGGG